MWVCVVYILCSTLMSLQQFVLIIHINTLGIHWCVCFLVLLLDMFTCCVYNTWMCPSFQTAVFVTSHMNTGGSEVKRIHTKNWEMKQTVYITRLLAGLFIMKRMESVIECIEHFVKKRTDQINEKKHQILLTRDQSLTDKIVCHMLLSCVARLLMIWSEAVGFSSWWWYMWLWEDGGEVHYLENMWVSNICEFSCCRSSSDWKLSTVCKLSWLVRCHGYNLNGLIM